MRVCRGRAAFKNAVFYIDDTEGSGRWFRFITAMLNPVRLVLLPLVAQEVPQPARSTVTRSDLDSWHSTTITHLWGFNPADVEGGCV